MSKVVRNMKSFNISRKIYLLISRLSKKSIVGQDLVNGGTIFLIKQRNKIIRKKAQDLYRELSFDNSWNRQDLMRIIITAINEQMLEDLSCINKTFNV